MRLLFAFYHVFSHLLVIVMWSLIFTRDPEVNVPLYHGHIRIKLNGPMSQQEDVEITMYSTKNYCYRIHLKYAKCVQRSNYGLLLFGKAFYEHLWVCIYAHFRQNNCNAFTATFFRNWSSSFFLFFWFYQ